MNDQDKITIAQEYFKRAEQGTPDIIELFYETAEVYFAKFGFGFGRSSLFELVQGFEGSLEYIRHDYESLTFIPSGDYLVVEGTSQRQDVWKLLGRRPNSRRAFLQLVQVSRWANFEPARLSRSRLYGRRRSTV